MTSSSSSSSSPISGILLLLLFLSSPASASRPDKTLFITFTVEPMHLTHRPNPNFFSTNPRIPINNNNADDDDVSFLSESRVVNSSRGLYSSSNSLAGSQFSFSGSGGGGGGVEWMYLDIRAAFVFVVDCGGDGVGEEEIGALKRELLLVLKLRCGAYAEEEVIVVRRRMTRR